MKKIIILMTVLILIIPIVPVFSAEQTVADVDSEGQASKTGGFKPCLYSIIYGPRAAYEFNEGRKIRTSEKFCLILPFAPIIKMLDAYDAYKGKTMSEIVIEEDLDEEVIDK